MCDFVGTPAKGLPVHARASAHIKSLRLIIPQIAPSSNAARRSGFENYSIADIHKGPRDPLPRFKFFDRPTDAGHGGQSSPVTQGGTGQVVLDSRF
jgi:hypothetical protein